jgi:hypothetical protein
MKVIQMMPWRGGRTRFMKSRQVDVCVLPRNGIGYPSNGMRNIADI